MPIAEIDLEQRQGRLFQDCLSRELDSHHKLYKLRGLVDWSVLESGIAGLIDVSDWGRNRKSIRVLLGVTMLQAMYNFSDCLSCETLSENVYWQYFCGYEYGQSGVVISESCLRRFRQEIKAEGFELILKELVRIGLKVGSYKKKDLDSVIIDTTVQIKNIKYPHDVYLLSRARSAVVKLSYELGLKLNDTYEKKYKRYIIKIWKYKGDSKSQQRRKLLKHLKVLLGRLVRVVERHIARYDQALNTQQALLLRKIKSVYAQSFLSKAARDRYKQDHKILYSFHAEEVECIGKGKLNKPYEFGNKVGIAVSGGGNFILGVKSFHGNPYDGHTLAQTVEALETTTEQGVGNIFVDLGYRGNNYQHKRKVYTPYTKKKITPEIKRMQKRRSAIEPVIGHLKQYGRMGRNYLKGILGDILNPLLSAIGFNMKALANTVTAKT